MNGTLWVSLGQAERLHGLILAVTLAALDADVLGLQVLVVLKDQPAFLVPERDALVHAVVPGLEALDGSLGSAAKHRGKVLLDALPLELLVVPGIDDEVTLLGGVFLVDVPVLTIWWGAGVAIVASMDVGIVHGIWGVWLLGRVLLHRWEGLGEE